MRNAEKDELEMAAKREAMINEGFRLFSEKGIENVSMQDVADACGIGIATLYRYYKTKLDLVIDIGAYKWKEYGEYVQKNHIDSNPGPFSAAKMFEFYLDFYIETYKNNKQLLIFNQYFNNYVIQQHATKEQMAPYNNSIARYEKLFDMMYEMAEKDGTIRTDIPKEKMFATTSHIMLAVGVRFALGVVYAAENEQDRTEEYELVKKMLMREYMTDKAL